MRFFPALATAAGFGMLAVVTSIHAQPLPLAQEYVANIGATPLKAPATADFVPTTSFTMEGWFYLTRGQNSAWLMGKHVAELASPGISFAVMLDSTGTKPVFSASTGAAGSGRSVVAPAALSLGAWAHLAAVYENGAMRLFVNGVVVATGTSSGPLLVAPSQPFSLGEGILANGNFDYPAFVGYACQVRFWNVARTAAQITAALNEFLPTDRTGLVAAWPLDESTGATLRDISGANRALSTASPTSPLPTIQAGRFALLAAGTFFNLNVTPLTGDTLKYISDSALIDFDGDGDLDLLIFQSYNPQSVPEVRTPVRAYRNNNGRLSMRPMPSSATRPWSTSDNRLWVTSTAMAAPICWPSSRAPTPRRSPARNPSSSSSRPTDGSWTKPRRDCRSATVSLMASPWPTSMATATSTFT